jgi:hypothetical protein
MMRRSSLVAAALSSLVALSCTDAPTAPRSSLTRLGGSANAAARNTPVKSQLVDGDTTPHSIGSDGAGLYQNGVNGVVSILQSGLGDWELDLSPQKSTRKARVSFADPLPGNPGAAPFTSALVKARFIAKASQVNGSSFAHMTGLGSTILTPLSVAFTHSGVQYGVRMNATNHPGTDWALVTCTAVADPGNPGTSSCTQWRVTPTGMYDGAAKNIGYVERVSAPATFIGMFYFSFELVISK